MTNGEWLVRKLYWVRPVCLPVSLLAFWWFAILPERSGLLILAALLWVFTTLVWVIHLVALVTYWLGRERGV